MAKLRSGELKITLAQHLETMLRRGRGVHFFVGVEMSISFTISWLQREPTCSHRSMKVGADVSSRSKILTSIASFL